MSRAPVDYISIAWSNPTELARLQQRLRPDFFDLHAQVLLALPSRELLLPVETQGPRALALPRAHGGQRSVGGGVRGQDDGVGYRPAAVGDVDACVAVIFLVVGGEGAARWDVGDGEGMGESGDIFVPVLTQGPAANAVPL